MAGEAINIGGIYADLDVNSGKMEQGIAKAQGAIKLISAEITNLDALLKSKGIGAPEHTALVNQYKQAITDLAARMQTAHAALGTSANGIELLNAKIAASKSAMAGGSTAAGGLARSLMQLGYIADDVRYSIGSVVNNIAPLAQSSARAFGASVESANLWAGGIQIAAVAAFELYNNWDKVLESLGTGRVKSEAEAMAELAKATKLTADQAERLARFKALENKGQEIREAKTESEEKAEKIATKAVVDAGIKNVRQGVIATAPELLDADADVVKAKKALEDAQSDDPSKVLGLRAVAPNDPAAIEAKEEEVRKARENLTNARRKAADRLISADTLPQFFKGGPGQLAALVKQNPGAFGEHNAQLQTGLENAQKEGDLSPEQRQQEKVKKAVAKAWGQIQDGLAKAAEKVGEEAAKEAEKLLQHQIKKAMPDLKDHADRLADKESRGQITREGSLKEIERALTAVGVKVADAVKTAKRQMDRTDEEDPVARRHRLDRDAKAKGKEAVPDLQDRADRLAAKIDADKDKVESAKADEDAAREALAADLEKHGVGKNRANALARAEMQRQAKVGADEPDDEGRIQFELALIKGGMMEPDEADKLATDEMSRRRKRRLNDAGKRDGMTPEKARAELSAEMMKNDGTMTKEKADRAAEEAMKEAGKENPNARALRLRQEAIRKAEDADPDLGKKVDAAIVMGMMGKADPEQSAKNIAKELEAQGLNKDVAAEGVRGKFGERSKEISEHLAEMNQQAMRGTPQEPSRSEVYAASELTHRVQSGVSDGPEREQRKTNELLQAQSEYLAEIARKVGGSGLKVK